MLIRNFLGIVGLFFVVSIQSMENIQSVEDLGYTWIIDDGSKCTYNDKGWISGYPEDIEQVTWNNIPYGEKILSSKYGVIGYLLYSQDHDEKVFRILNFQFRKGFKDTIGVRGIELLEAGLKDMKNRGCTKVIAPNVRLTDPDKPYYERTGFKVIKEYDYPKGTLFKVDMEKDLTKNDW